MRQLFWTNAGTLVGQFLARSDSNRERRDAEKAVFSKVEMCFSIIQCYKDHDLVEHTAADITLDHNPKPLPYLQGEVVGHSITTSAPTDISGTS